MIHYNSVIPSQLSGLVTHPVPDEATVHSEMYPLHRASVLYASVDGAVKQVLSAQELVVEFQAQALPSAFMIH